MYDKAGALSIAKCFILEQLISNYFSIDTEEGTVFICGGKKIKQRTLKFKSNQKAQFIRYIEQDRPHLISQPTKHLFVSIRGLQMSVDSLHAFISRM